MLMLHKPQRPERNGVRFERQVRFALSEAGAAFTTGTIHSTTVYGEPWRNDIFVTNAQPFPHGLVIECRWQSSNGSADEKFFPLVHNIRRLPCPGIIVIGGRNAVLQGKGARPACLAWTRQQVDERLIGVYTLEEFIAWLPNLPFHKTTLW